jgi:hypothetical protein
MKQAHIKWTDAFAYDDCQKPDQEFPIYDVITSGTIIKETEEYITVCRDYFEGKDELGPLARYSISIPKKMITAIVVEDTDDIFNKSK